jgi:hypothetical protein
MVTQMCIKQWPFADSEALKVVWNNLLAVASSHGIMLIDWDGNVVQTFRGHSNGSISSLQFYQSRLISFYIYIYIYIFHLL